MLSPALLRVDMHSRVWGLAFSVQGSGFGPLCGRLTSGDVLCGRLRVRVCVSAKFSEVATAYEVLAIAPHECLCMHRTSSLNSYMNHAPHADLVGR
jgi:hypothetical protein